MHPKLMVKVLIGLKRALKETNGLDIGCKFAKSLVYNRVVVETKGRTSVPNSNLRTPPGPLLR